MSASIRRIYCVIGDTVIIPVLMGARKIAHFGLQQEFARECYDLLQNEFESKGLHCHVGDVFNHGSEDFLVYRDQNTINEFVKFFQQCADGDITNGSYGLGRLFGYDDSAISEYLNGPIYPRDGSHAKLYPLKDLRANRYDKSKTICVEIS